MPVLTLCTNFLYGLQIDEQPALSLLSLPPAEWSSRLFFSSPQAPISGCRGFGRSLGSPTPQISTVCTSKSTNSHPRNFRLVQLATTSPTAAASSLPSCNSSSTTATSNAIQRQDIGTRAARNLPTHATEILFCFCPKSSAMGLHRPWSNGYT